MWQPQRLLDDDQISLPLRPPAALVATALEAPLPRRRGCERQRRACRRSSRALRCSSGSVRIEDELPTQDGAFHPHHGLPGGSAPARPPPRAAPLDPRRASARGSVGSGVVLWSRKALCCSSGSVRIEDELPTQDGALHPHYGLPGGSAPARLPPRAAPLDPRRASARGRVGRCVASWSRKALCCSSGSVRIEDELPTQDRALHPHYGLPGGSAPARPPPRAEPLDPRRAPASAW